MRVIYRNVKLYQKSYDKLEKIREALQDYGVFLNKTQTLNYAIEHLRSGLEKINTRKDGSN
ncbi:hypothetical protein [Rufibacter immobilis]|uniref:hypothetical protein n=1 Tax=Rufibacter immobilis TaxID=1348778 RepID=UPI0035EE9FFF